ncbi:hypothetical protein C8A00DRAFT_47219 [Chaetomidium leptoderma]|uniref:HIT domain-containing protein n=1 Tax=Chaetomidium leptoderma TaxID=669021 RepID=A0AAN6VCT6_9PEZI|nr:hypothetical protein C8A00DRAFT_47219 [Chaetomidium leptoderma]
MASCIFCKIIKGKQASIQSKQAASSSFRPSPSEIPCFKLLETDKTLAFLDINPLSQGHALVIPKIHGEKLADIPDDHLTEILPIAKKLVIATGAQEYNILQNNGAGAHQEVGHIPKPSAQEGLGIGWPQQTTDMDKLKALSEEIKAKV